MGMWSCKRGHGSAKISSVLHASDLIYTPELQRDILGCYVDSSYDLVNLHDICMMHVATALCVTLHQILQSCKQFGSAMPPAKAINLKQ